MQIQGKWKIALAVAAFALIASPALAQCGSPCKAKPAVKAADTKDAAQAKTPCCDTGCKPGCCPDCSGCCPDKAAAKVAGLKTPSKGCRGAKSAKVVSSKDASSGGCKPGCGAKTVAAKQVAPKKVVGGCCGAAKVAKNDASAKPVAAKSVTTKSVTTKDDCCAGCNPGCCQDCPPDCCPEGGDAAQAAGRTADAKEGCPKQQAGAGRTFARLVSALLTPVWEPQIAAKKPCCPSARDN